MSLINEALKKAEHEKRANSAPFTTYAAMKEAVKEPSPQTPRSRWPKAVVLLLVPVACVVLYMSVASVGDAHPPANDANLGALSLAPAPVGGPGKAPLLATMGEGDADMLIVSPSEPVGEIAPSPELADPRPGLVMADLPDAPVGRPVAPAGGGAEARNDRGTPAISKDDYSLTAVMRGPAGATAIINGQFVTVGDTLAGAEVVKVGRHSVELQVEGHTFTIQM
jgi:hypothetical protein